MKLRIARKIRKTRTRYNHYTDHQHSLADRRIWRSQRRETIARYREMYPNGYPFPEWKEPE